MEWFKFILVTFFIVFGIVMELIAIYGVNKFHFVLNRMHAAAIGDTMALGFVIFGLIIAKGFSFAALKLLIVLICLWTASAVSSHVLSRMEITIDEETIPKECEVQKE